MKKFILILLMTLTLTSFFAINIFAINVDYTFNITDNKKWNLETGSIENDLKFAVTSKMIIKDDRIITSSETYHHVVFWNSKNQYIGYKNSQYSILENDYYLGNIEYGSAGFDAPANAHFFSFMIYKSGNSIPIAELNNQSLSDIFDNFTHQGNDTPLSTLNNQSLNDVFVDGNQFLNHDFTDGTNNWAVDSGTLTIENNRAKVVNNIAYSLRQNVNYILDHKYYGSYEFEMIQGNSSSSDFGRAARTNPSYISIIYPILNTIYRQSGIFTSIYNGFDLIYAITRNTNSAIDNITYYDNFYFIDLTALGIDNLTKAQLDAYYDAYQRTINNGPINDIVSEYAIDYAIANNPTINLTYNEWYDYYNNYLTYQDANDRIESGLNNLTLNDVFLDGNLITNGDFSNGTTDWLSTASTLSVLNNILTQTSDGSSTTMRLGYKIVNGNGLSNEKYYINLTSKHNFQPTNYYLLLREASAFGTILATLNVVNDVNVSNYVNYSSILTTSNSYNNNLFIYFNSGGSATDDSIDYSNVLTISLTDLGIDNLTTAQMDAYFNDYKDNQTLEQNLYLQALTPTSFDLIDPNYDYTAPPPDDFLDVDSDTFLDNLLTNIGFNNDLGKVTLSILILFLTTLTLIKFNLGTSVILGVDILVYVGLTFLGWLPAWINILIALIIMVLFYLRFKGGGSNNEESD